MKNIYPFLFCTLFLFSCGEEGLPVDENVLNEQTDEDTGPLEERAKRHVESNLGINATEKYTMEIYREHLDGDDKEDAIITVNRLEFAINEAVANGNVAKRAEIGYMGSYNYIFFYDGGLNKISPPIAIPSTPQKSLSVRFEHVSSDAYKDILIDFRIRNASYRDIYTVNNHTPRRIFQWKNFDGLGTTTMEAYTFEFKETAPGLHKDILVLNSSYKNPEGVFDQYTFEPELKKDGKIAYRFFYSAQHGKYVTEKQ